MVSKPGGNCGNNRFGFGLHLALRAKRDAAQDGFCWITMTFDVISFFRFWPGVYGAIQVNSRASAGPWAGAATFPLFDLWLQSPKKLGAMRP
ncbi:MAG: hypothetical protein QNJ44_06680 [Rhodobacter sp.]|nr:hypothetical protein [Rhodobacter sp.]